MKPLATTLLLLVLASSLYSQEEPDKVHVRIYKKVAPATVYIESQSGRYRGSGVIIDQTGTILTSTMACGTTTDVVSVLVKGGKTYTGRVMGRATQHELILIKIDGKDSLPFVELGDSDAARVGQVSYVLGDCFDSLRTDDQPALSVGVISGIYDIAKRQPEVPARSSKSADVWFGAEVTAVKGGLEVTRVSRKSPAQKAGLQKGDVLVSVDSTKMLTEAALNKALASKSAGDAVDVTVLR